MTTSEDNPKSMLNDQKMFTFQTYASTDLCISILVEVFFDYPACIHHVYRPETVAHVAQLIGLSSISRTNAYAPIAHHRLLIGHGASYTLELFF